MPAITVDDVLVLPRIPEPDPAAAVDRPVRSVTTAPRGFEGEGFPVRRAFAGVDLGDLDPFIHMDEMGEVEWEPGAAKGTSWHPHRGFETVTYMLDGTFQHQDSNGGGGIISDGDTQWMTAGGGILHIEAPPEEVVAAGGTFHGIQLWVNLPSRLKMTAPRYQDIRGGEVALLTNHDGGALLRVIAGEVAGHAGPGITHTPIALLHATVQPGADLRLPWPRRLQRPRLRDGRATAPSALTGWPSQPVSSPCSGPATSSRVHADDAAGRAHARTRGAGARRPPDPGAGRRLRARS